MSSRCLADSLASSWSYCPTCSRPSEVIRYCDLIPCLDKPSDVQQGGFTFRWSYQLDTGYRKPFAPERDRQGQRGDASIVHCHCVLDREETGLENPSQKQVPFRWCFSQNGKRDGIDLLKDFT